MKTVNWTDNGGPSGCALLMVLPLLLAVLLWLSEPSPGDAPGDDCPDHGPYADDDCPKCDED